MGVQHLVSRPVHARAPALFVGIVRGCARLSPGATGESRQSHLCPGFSQYATHPAAALKRRASCVVEPEWCDLPMDQGLLQFELGLQVQGLLNDCDLSEHGTTW